MLCLNLVFCFFLKPCDIHFVFIICPKVLVSIIGVPTLLQMHQNEMQQYVIDTIKKYSMGLGDKPGLYSLGDKDKVAILADCHTIRESQVVNEYFDFLGVWVEFDEPSSDVAFQDA